MTMSKDLKGHRSLGGIGHKNSFGYSAVLAELHDPYLVSYSLLLSTSTMLAATTSRLTVRAARRAAIVGIQRQAAVQAIKKRDNVSIRGIQSVAQTDRVCSNPFLTRLAVSQSNIST